MHSDISFLTAAKGTRLIAKAVCVKNGRSAVCYRVEISDDLENLVAIVTVTGYNIA